MFLVPELDGLFGLAGGLLDIGQHDGGALGWQGGAEGGEAWVELQGVFDGLGGAEVAPAEAIEGVALVCGDDHQMSSTVVTRPAGDVGDGVVVVTPAVANGVDELVGVAVAFGGGVVVAVAFDEQGLGPAADGEEAVNEEAGAVDWFGGDGVEGGVSGGDLGGLPRPGLRWW